MADFFNRIGRLLPLTTFRKRPKSDLFPVFRAAVLHAWHSYPDIEWAYTFSIGALDVTCNRV